MPSLGIDLPYGKEKHKRIAKAIAARYELSKRDMTDLVNSCLKADEKHIAYLPEKEADRLRRGRREEGDPQYTTVVVPYSYAVLMTAHTYWTSVLLSRSPVFQYTARHGNTPGSQQCVEALIDYQTMVGRMLPMLYMWLLDAGKYGLGIVGCGWEEEYADVAQIEEVEELFLNILPTGRMKRKKVTQRVYGYRGNKLVNIHPSRWFPDTRLPLNRFQEGEFCGWYEEMTWNQLLKGEADGRYINVDVLKLKKFSGAKQWELSSQLPQPGQNSDTLGLGDTLNGKLIQDTRPIPVIRMTVELVPSEWMLGGGSNLEKWVFTITEDMDLILEARPLGTWCNKYQFSVLQYEPEPYALYSRGMHSISSPMQDALDWLLNSHMYNVRKALNNQVVVDPSRLVMSDVLNPRAGGIWRLRPAAYGTDPKLAYSQLQIGDSTSTHVKDMQVFAEIIQRALGVNDNLMGMVNAGGRKTATEVRSSTSFGINRLKTNSEFFSATGWSDLSQMMLQLTQQYYDWEMSLKVAGDLNMQGQPNFMQVSPEQIQGFFDFVPVDGTLPIDRFAQATLWKELMGQFQTVPQLAVQYDVGAIFGYIVNLMGIKDLSRFKLKVAPTILPDGEVDTQAAAGNIIPLGGVNGNAGGAAGGSGPATSRNNDVPVPRQISGLGPAG